MKRYPWFEIILIVVVMSISLYAALSDGQNLSWRWFTRDDAYYYFKVAQNISEGKGSTFDGINPTNGYHPLWMLICIPIFALARFDIILPLRLVLLVMSGLSVATAILLYRLLGKVFSASIGALAAIFWVFSYDVLVIVYRQGLETGIAAFFILLLIYKLYEFERSWRVKEVSRKQIALLGIIAVLAMFSRLDLVFLAGMAGLWIVFRGHPLRILLPIDITSILVSTFLAFLLRISLREYYTITHLALVMAGLSLVVKISCAYFFGLYQKSILAEPRELLGRLGLFIVTSSGIISVTMLAALYAGILEGSFPRTVLLIDMALTLLLFGISRLIYIGLKTGKPTQLIKPLDDLRQNWKTWLSDGIVYFGILLGSLGVYMAWNKIAFGTTSPVSGQIKRWWGSLPGRTYGGSARDPLAFFGMNYSGEGNVWNPVSRTIGAWAERLNVPGINIDWRYLILLSLFAVLFFFLLRTNRQMGRSAVVQLGIIPLMCSAWLQVLYYHSAGYSAYNDWYWVGQLVLVVLTGGLILGMIHRLIAKFRYINQIAWVLVACVGVSMGMSHWRTVQQNMPYNQWAPNDPYMDIVPLLEQNTEPGSLIGMTGGGNTGYFIHDRTVLNMDGLINSYPYFLALQKRQGGDYLHNIGLDYVLANTELLDQQPYKGQFNEYLNPMDIFYGGKQLLRYGDP